MSLVLSPHVGHLQECEGPLAQALVTTCNIVILLDAPPSAHLGPGHEGLGVDVVPDLTSPGQHRGHRGGGLPGAGGDDVRSEGNINMLNNIMF